MQIYLSYREVSSVKNITAYKNIGLTPIAKPYQNDSVSFGNAVPIDVVEAAAKGLTAGTSGLRGEAYGKILNEKLVRLMSKATSLFVHQKSSGQTPKILVGNDTRKFSKEMANVIAQEHSINGVDVYKIDEPAATPAVALIAREKKVDLGYLLTPSHNPWADGGINMVTKDATIAPPSVTKLIGSIMIDIAKGNITVHKSTKAGKITIIDAYKFYKGYLDVAKNPHTGEKLVDFDAIAKFSKENNLEIYYDSLNGTGQYYMPRLLEEHGIKLSGNLNTMTEGPNPTEKNLREMSSLMKKSENRLKIGLSTDGDSDRFGILDENGNFISPNDTLLLVAHHLVKNKGCKNGYMIRSLSTTLQLDAYAKQHGLDIIQTPVGFKYIGEKMLELEKEGKTVVLGGEESGGATIGGHIPEKDGIIVLLQVLELMSKEKKPLSEILKDIKKSLGKEFIETQTAYKMTEEAKEAFIGDFDKIFKAVKAGKTDESILQGLGKVLEIDSQRTVKEFKEMCEFKPDGDGVKLCFNDGSSLTIRKSGTEPIARVYYNILDDTSDGAQRKYQSLQSFVKQIADKHNAVVK